MARKLAGQTVSGACGGGGGLVRAVSLYWEFWASHQSWSERPPCTGSLLVEHHVSRAVLNSTLAAQCSWLPLTSTSCCCLAGTLLGGITFRNVLVRYDRANKRIGFGPGRLPADKLQSAQGVARARWHGYSSASSADHSQDAAVLSCCAPLTYCCNPQPRIFQCC